MSKYSPQYVEQLAEEIMLTAKWVVIVRTLIGVFVGIGIGLFVSNLNPFNPMGSIGPIIGAVICGGLGYYTAQSIVLHMRAEAQLMLTQLQIEKNTRSGGSIHVDPAPQAYHQPTPRPAPIAPAPAQYQPTPAASPTPMPAPQPGMPPTPQTNHQPPPQKQPPVNPPSRNPQRQGNRQR